MASGRRPPGSLPALVGMIHLLPLPGSPRYAGSMQAAIEDAVERASLMTEAGFGALMVENFGDAPFFPDEVPPVTVAAMTECLGAVRQSTSASLGVNVLRNDAGAALGIAAATGAAFIRVNVLSGVMYTDQGPIVGRAAEILRLRAALEVDAAIWADVFVKHASPPPGATIEETASDIFERGGADALVVSGPRTGHAVEPKALEQVREAVPQAPLVVGSGAGADSLGRLAEIADHIIVGTALERDGVPGAALDPDRIGRFMEAASSAGLA